MKTKEAFIGILPMGRVPQVACKVVTIFLRSSFGMDIRTLPSVGEPLYALDAKRGQYNAAYIIERLESMDQECVKLVGLLNLDLFIPVFTHVIGEAREGGRAAVVSLYRLRGDPAGPDTSQDTILERVAKVAVHETGHLFGIAHCHNRGCVMRFSLNLTELDATPSDFCRYCHAYVEEAVRRARRS
jgi:archaemetzincin